MVLLLVHPFDSLYPGKSLRRCHEPTPLRSSLHSGYWIVTASCSSVQQPQTTTTTTELPRRFNGLFSRTTWVSRYQKGNTSLDIKEARDDGVLGMQRHQLDHMQTICTSLKTDNHINTSSLSYTGRMLFLTPNQQCQSTEGAQVGTSKQVI